MFSIGGNFWHFKFCKLYLWGFCFIRLRWNHKSLQNFTNNSTLKKILPYDDIRHNYESLDWNWIYLPYSWTFVLFDILFFNVIDGPLSYLIFCYLMSLMLNIDGPLSYLIFFYLMSLMLNIVRTFWFNALSVLDNTDVND